MGILTIFVIFSTLISVIALLAVLGSGEDHLRLRRRLDDAENALVSLIKLTALPKLESLIKDAEKKLN